MKKIKIKKKYLIGAIIVAILFLIAITLSIFFILKDKPDIKKKTDKEKPDVVEKVDIVDLNSNSRPYAVMINNHPDARAHHAGLQDAYMIYEFIVEGGLTRYLALFKDQQTEKIGSVRSSRHYFLDYALENDAIYVHWGWSPQAQSDISTLKINNINGLAYEGIYFYRDKSLNVALEHTGFTTMEMLKNATQKLKYRETTDKGVLLNYIPKDNELQNKENATVANEVTIKYSNAVTTSYTYDEATKTYKRFVNGKEHVDDITKEQYTTKNIIAYSIYNSTISGDDKGRQNFDNIGSGDGVYITNGYSIPIKWSKAKREEKTKYTYLDGTELEVSDGNTYIQVYPKTGSITIK